MTAFFLLPPLLLDLALVWLFGKGLRPGRTPLLTRLATEARDGRLDPRARHYTRQLTWLWAAAPAALGLLIAPGLLVESWRPVAAAVALGQGPFYLALLIAEHFFRRRHLDHLDHMGFVAFLRFLRHVDYAAALRE